MIHQIKGRIRLPKRMIFWKTSKGGGVIFNPKKDVADLGPLYRYFQMFSEKIATYFFENEGVKGRLYFFL